MGYVLLWLTTVFISFCKGNLIISKLAKDIGDAGFKININKLDEMNDILRARLSKGLNPISLPVLVPFYNIYYTGKKNQEYDKKKKVNISKTKKYSSYRKNGCL